MTQILKEVLIYDWKKLTPPFIINQVIEFSQTVKKVAERHHFHELLVWAIKLKKEASLFKMQNIEKDLKVFPIFVKQIEELKKSS